MSKQQVSKEVRISIAHALSKMQYVNEGITAKDIGLRELLRACKEYRAMHGYVPTDWQEEMIRILNK